MTQKTILVCQGKTCGHNPLSLLQVGEQKIQQESLSEKVCIRRSGCLGQCKKSPNIRIEGEGQVHNHVTPKKLESIIDTAAGKQQKPVYKTGDAKKMMNGLLGGGF